MPPEEENQPPQAVAPTEEVATPTLEGEGSAPEKTAETASADSFEDLLSQFDNPPSDPAQAVTPEVQQQQTQQQAESQQGDSVAAIEKAMYQRDMADLVDNVRKDLDPKVYTDQFIESWVVGLAENDPRINNAWDQRITNRNAYKKVVEGLSNQLAKTFQGSKVDPKATEARDIVANAVKGSSTAPAQTEQADYGKLDNSGFMSDVSEKYGYMPRV